MNDGLLIEIVHGSHDPILEFLFGRDADVAEDGAGKFIKKPSTRLSQEPCLGVKVMSTGRGISSLWGAQFSPLGGDGDQPFW